MTDFSRRAVLTGAATSLLLTLPTFTAPASAADFPSRQIRIVVGYTPGGEVDILARIVADKLSKKFGVSAYVDNKPGDASIIGAHMVSLERPDGYNLFFASSAFAINASSPHVTYKLSDFTPITQATSAPRVVYVTDAVPAKTLQEFIAYAKANPGKLNYASTGAGGFGNVSTEAFKLAAGINLQHIPYKGVGEIMTALLAGDIQVYLGSIGGADAQLADGKLKALAITSDKRAASLPNVPTTAEAGLAGYTSSQWYGLLGPKGMPADVTMKIRDAVADIVKMPDVVKILTAQGSLAVGSTPEEFAKFLANEAATMKVVADKTGVRGD